MDPQNVHHQNFLAQTLSQVRELAAAKLPRKTRKRIMELMRRATHNASVSPSYGNSGGRYHVLSAIWGYIPYIIRTLAVARKTQRREFQPASASPKTRKRPQRTASLISTFAPNKGSNRAAHFNFPRRSNITALTGKSGNQQSLSNINGNKAASGSAKPLTNAGRNVLKPHKAASNNTTRTALSHYVVCGPRTTPIGQG